MNKSILQYREYSHLSPCHLSVGILQANLNTSKQHKPKHKQEPETDTANKNRKPENKLKPQTQTRRGKPETQITDQNTRKNQKVQECTNKLESETNTFIRS